MAQYIDKSALVAEIKKLLDRYVSVHTFNYGATQDLNHLLSFLNTLEVKEVNLEKEIDRVWDNTSDNFSEDGWKEFEDIAKYFFELGLKTQKGE